MLINETQKAAVFKTDDGDLRADLAQSRESMRLYAMEVEQELNGVQELVNQLEREQVRRLQDVKQFQIDRVVLTSRAMATQQETVVRRHVHAGCVLVAEMCRPRAKNAFNDALYEQLTAALDAFEADDALHAFVLTGHGDYFTSGADVKETAAILGDGSVRPPSQSPSHAFMRRMVSCKKLLVAAVNGPAIGIGVTLLMHCDVVLAAERATFWTPFLRIGVVPEFASSYTFPHLLGPTVASNLVLRSKVYSAQEALAAKIVGDVLPTAGFLDAVLAELTPLVSNRFNKTSLPVYKTLLRREREPKIREALHYEFEQLDRRAASGEFLATVMELKKQFANKNSSKL
ncbi:unnamed protein product [Phytophthora lilii]|uniref:Unnamed protein product n=1 Tax=Phytophthora lilii TaxID=2077276 RepID=A0A9W6WPU9_9STRA|nr:unnamed protein product [Phytophthora lilii]